jgi:hypothetical protein
LCNGLGVCSLRGESGTPYVTRQDLRGKQPGHTVSACNNPRGGDLAPAHAAVPSATADSRGETPQMSLVCGKLPPCPLNPFPTAFTTNS